MATYGEIQDRIADDLKRTDLDSQIRQEIKSAIKAYRGHRLMFNETRDTLTGTTSQNYLTPPTDLIAIDDLYLTSNSHNIRMVPMSLNDIVEGRRTSNAQPTAYCLYGNRIELDTPCASAYSFPIYYVYELAELSDDSEENGWTTDAEELIVNRAEKILFARILKDRSKAADCAQLEREAYTMLRAASNRRAASGQAKACYL